MDIAASIIDQRVNGLREEIRQRAADELGVKNDEAKLKSLTFVFLTVMTVLDLDFDEAFDCVVEGGQDFGVDAIHMSEERDGEFIVTIVQGKYKDNLEGTSGFPQTGIEKLVQAIRHLFDPASALTTINARLLARVEAVRSMISDGFIPQVRAIACNNGLKWQANGEEVIQLAKLPPQVTWEHVNHESLIKILQATKRVSHRLQFSGKALVEDMYFSRVLVGRVAVGEIHALVEQHGERLLERNVRRYLGLIGNRVNEGIVYTLQAEPENFYFYNNGITMTCDKLSYNALQSADFSVQIENLQIINGGQTCMTIARALGQESAQASPASVLVRLYQLHDDNDDFVQRVTYATNSQNPVDLRDLRANDGRQQRLEQDIDALGYKYRRKRAETVRASENEISSGTAAEAVLCVWRQLPHQARFFRREHFGKLYNTIFKTDLSGAQVVLAVLLYRIAENRRRRPHENDPAYVRYASCFIAMQMGRRLLAELELGKSALTHKDFERARAAVVNHGDRWYDESRDDIARALADLYGAREISLQQLSATFRRGDLIARLGTLDILDMGSSR